ncbi:MAG TPA: hypothetical protein VJ246_01895 [Patescibacteria group bacterium]|nr:hypothetical protein [Patescibacteria group bacterium]
MSLGYVGRFCEFAAVRSGIKKPIELGGKRLHESNDDRNTPLLLWVTTIPDSGGTGGVGVSQFALALSRRLAIPQQAMFSAGRAMRELSGLQNEMEFSQFLKERTENQDRQVDSLILRQTAQALLSHPLVLVDAKVALTGAVRNTLSELMPDHTQLGTGITADPHIAAERIRNRERSKGNIITLDEARGIRKTRYKADGQAYRIYGLRYDAKQMRKEVSIVENSSYFSPDAMVDYWSQFVLQQWHTIFFKLWPYTNE